MSNKPPAKTTVGESGIDSIIGVSFSAPNLSRANHPLINIPVEKRLVIEREGEAVEMGFYHTLNIAFKFMRYSAHYVSSEGKVVPFRFKQQSQHFLR